MYKSIEDSDHQRLAYLDAARGIAAIMVMVYHFVNWKSWNQPWKIWITLLFNGVDAVSFFFVLSGFVLSYKYILYNKPLDIRKFYVQRLFRLWPAFFITVVFNALNSFQVGNVKHNILEIFVLNKTHFWEEASLFRSHPQYYGPGWTLVLELTFSFFMPFAIALAKKNKTIIYWLLFFFIVLGGNLGELNMFYVHFTLGVLISCLYVRITEEDFLQSKWYRYRYLLLSFSFLLFSFRHIVRMSPLIPDFAHFRQYLGITYFHFTGLASFIFIIAIIRSERVQRFLQKKLLLYFGKVSYCIYLVHWLLVKDIYLHWAKLSTLFTNHQVAYLFIFVSYVAATLSLASLLHYAIELPFIKLGKRVVAQMKPSLTL